MFGCLHPGCTDKTYLLIHEIGIELLRSDLGEYVLGQLIADLIGFLVVNHGGLRLFEKIAELLAMAANHLFVEDNLGREVRSAFDVDRRSHEHLGWGDIDEIWNVRNLNEVIAIIHRGWMHGDS